MFYRDKLKIGNDSRSLPFTAGSLWGAVSSPAGPGQSSGGSPVGEAPGRS